jgi:hypothetical protein
MLVVATAPNSNGGRVTGTGGGTGDDVLPIGGCFVVVVTAGDASGALWSPGSSPSPETNTAGRLLPSGGAWLEAR